jgi:hypothetical protein
MLDEQAQLDDADSADFVVMRALLKRGRGEADSVDTFEPYTHIQEPNPGAREGMVQIIRQSLGGKKEAFVFVNNRLEGNAPSTIEAMVDWLRGRSRTASPILEIARPRDEAEVSGRAGRRFRIQKRRRPRELRQPRRTCIPHDRPRHLSA